MDTEGAKESVTHITAVDLGWIAGFLEGEGSFFSASRTGKPKRKPQVVAAQVQIHPLHRLQRLLGGTIRLRNERRPNHSPCYVWRVCGGKAVGVMMTLYPLMSPKRQEQILSVVTAWRIPGERNTSKYKTHCCRGHEFTPENTARGRSGAQRICIACRRERERQRSVRGRRLKIVA